MSKMMSLLFNKNGYDDNADTDTNDAKDADDADDNETGE